MLSRRKTLTLLAGAAVVPHAATANPVRELTWEDLIPAGLSYPQIVAAGEIDRVNDTWKPVYDANATRLNQSLDGAYVRLPGFIIPLDLSHAGITQFILVPYVGACVHTPPPPANQLVIVRADKSWDSSQIWDPVWVTGFMRTQLQSTSLGQTGYSIAADDMEVYEW